MIEVLRCTVNNKPVEVGIDPRESLADVLRERLGLTSVKKGCEVGECGACTVLVDGTAIDYPVVQGESNFTCPPWRSWAPASSTPGRSCASLSPATCAAAPAIKTF